MGRNRRPGQVIKGGREERGIESVGEETASERKERK